jgi:signal transduction histidine kinase
VQTVFDYTQDASSVERERLGRLAACLQTYVGHELANQLVPIQAFARILLEDHAGALGAEGRVLLDRLAALAQRAGTLSRRVAELGRLLREPAGGPPLPLDEVVAEALAEVGVLGAPAGVTYDVQQPLPSVRAGRALLHQVLVALLCNAGQAMARRPGVVRVGGRAAPGGAVVWVQDAGAGLTEGQAALFEPFAAGRFPGAAGAGLGLFLVCQAAALWRGRLQVDSRPGEGSTFSLFIPDGAGG